MTRAASRKRSTWRAMGLLVLLALVTPVVAGQVVKQPVKGNFEHLFMVNGRVVSQDGWPMDRVNVSILITGLDGVQVEPLVVPTDCHGDFSAYFRLGTLVGNAKVTVTIKDDDTVDVPNERQTQKLDKFFRRNDFVFTVPMDWPYGCQGPAGSPREYWPTRMTVWGRVVEGVEEHVVNGTTLESRPVQYWPLNLTITTHDRTWPPDSVQPTDPRGDFKYSWTFDDNLTEGHVDVEILGQKARAEVDPVTRIAFFKLNTGEPSSMSTPAPGLLLAVGALAIAAALGVRPRKRGRA